MAPDSVSRNPPALPSASAPWPRMAAWRRLWRDDTVTSLLLPVSLRGAAGSASVRSHMMRCLSCRFPCHICRGTRLGKQRAILNLTTFQHSPLFLPRRLDLEFTQRRFHFSKRFLSKLPELIPLLELLKLFQKLTLPFPNHIKLQTRELPILPEKLRLQKHLKLNTLIMPFLNHIKTRLLKILKQ